MFWADMGSAAAATSQHAPNNGNSKQQHSKQQQQQQPLSCNNTSSSSTITNSNSKQNPQQQQHSCSIRIERADMDGSKRSILIKDQLGWPNGLTTIHLGTSSSYQYSSYASLLNKQTEDVCSLKNLKVIFIDSKLRTLEMIDLDGNLASFLLIYFIIYFLIFYFNFLRLIRYKS